MKTKFKITIVLMFIMASFSLNAQGPTTYGDGAGQFGNYSSTYIGKSAGYLNSEWNNTFIGYNSGTNNTTGQGNSFLGVNAGKNNKGNGNSFLGINAGKNNEGDRNTFIGSNVGVFNVSGSNNTYLGHKAGYAGNGSGNLILGYQAGRNATGSNNIFLGLNTGFSATGSNNIFLGYNVGVNETESNKLYIDNSNTLEPLIYGDFFTDELTFNATVNIGNVPTPSGYKLYVDDGILTEKVKVATVGTGDWADYVFEEDYDLNSIEEVEQFVKANKHLPNVPSAKQVEENGVEMVEMDATLLRQIEELWLHVIELKKENEALKEEVRTLSNK